jgi:hypothetical protein
MKALNFKEVNVQAAKDQEQYLTLPGYRDHSVEGQFTFCMGLSFRERLRILFRGRIWVGLLTFQGPITPSRFSTKKSDLLG